MKHIKIASQEDLELKLCDEAKYNLFLMVDKLYFLQNIDQFRLFFSCKIFSQKIEDNVFYLFCATVKDSNAIKLLINDLFQNEYNQNISNKVVFFVSDNHYFSCKHIYELLSVYLFKNNYIHEKIIVEIDDIIEKYNKFFEQQANIAKILNKASPCISFYEQKIVKPNKNFSKFTPVAIEILSRLKDVEKERLIYPLDFLQILESNLYLFDKFEFMVYDNFYYLVKQWNNPEKLHINFSLRFMCNHISLFETWNKNEIKKVVIELNETKVGYISYTDLKETVKILKEKDFMVVFDDFGKGINNLDNFLSIFNYIDGFKISLELIWNLDLKSLIENEGENNNVFSFLIKLFGSFQFLRKINVYYEQIESAVHLDLIKETNIFNDVYLQGFLFHIPKKMVL